jgi:hypothetical protein
MDNEQRRSHRWTTRHGKICIRETTTFTSSERSNTRRTYDDAFCVERKDDCVVYCDAESLDENQEDGSGGVELNSVVNSENQSEDDKVASWISMI